MTPQAFRATRRALGLTQRQLAEALDLGKRTVELYESETKPLAVPKTVRLALAALVAGVTDYAGPAEP